MRISDWSSDVCSSDLLKDRALIAEEAARDVMGVSNSEGAGASAGRTHIALATSHGFSGSYAATSHGCYASVLAGEGSGMQRDYASHTARNLSELEAAASNVVRAGQRPVARLNPGKKQHGPMTNNYDPPHSPTLDEDTTEGSDSKKG